MSQYRNSLTDTYEPIPEAKYYVLGNDKFMSGWGAAKGRINTIVVPCNTSTEVDNAFRIMEGRDEMIYVRICYTKPRAKAHVMYSLISDWATDRP